MTFTDPLILLILFDDIFTVEAHESPRECKEGIGEGHEIPSLGEYFSELLRTFMVQKMAAPALRGLNQTFATRSTCLDL